MAYIFILFFLSRFLFTSEESMQFKSPDSTTQGESVRKLIAIPRDRVFPALINIKVITVHYDHGKEVKGQSGGSGVIISREGHVLTNYHVTENGRFFKCALSNKTEVRAHLIGEDPLTDLAILKLDETDIKQKGITLPIAYFGDSSQLQMGDYVFAMGSPYTLARSITFGIVSNTERVLAMGIGGHQDGGIQLESGQRTGLFTRWIQHDAAVNPGNSGGPLVNLSGEVVGVNELGGKEIGFAIPSNLAKEIATKLIKDGQVNRSWIGLTLHPQKGTGIHEGTPITTIFPDSPSEKAGLTPGDILISVNGGKINLTYPEEIPLFLKGISDYPIGTSLKFEWLHQGKPCSGQVITEKWLPDFGERANLKDWGIVVEEITPFLAHELGLRSKDGIIVQSSRDGWPGTLADVPLRAGDVITSLNDKKVKNLTDIDHLYREWIASPYQDKTVHVAFVRENIQLFTKLIKTPARTQQLLTEVPKAWAAFEVVPLSDGNIRPDDNPDVGLYINHVYPGTNANIAGLSYGDIIVGINGERWEQTIDPNSFFRSIESLDIGSPLTLTIKRGEQLKDISFNVQSAPVKPEEMEQFYDPILELTIRDVTYFDKIENHWPINQKGVMIVEPDRNGWGQLGGLSDGELITEIQGEIIEDFIRFKTVVEKIQAKKLERVVVKCKNGSKTLVRYVALQMTID